MVRAAISEFDLGSHGFKELALGLNIANVGNAFENDWFLSQNGSCHGRQSRVFCAADTHGANQRITATNYKLVHRGIRL